MKIYITPSRILNDERGILGLYTIDIAAGVGIFVLLSMILEETPISLLSLPLSILGLIPLSIIRLSTRRHIIRDVIGYLLTSKKLFKVRKYVCSRVKSY